MGKTEGIGGGTEAQSARRRIPGNGEARVQKRACRQRSVVANATRQRHPLGSLPPRRPHQTLHFADFPLGISPQQPRRQSPSRPTHGKREQHRHARWPRPGAKARRFLLDVGTRCEIGQSNRPTGKRVSSCAHTGATATFGWADSNSDTRLSGRDRTVVPISRGHKVMYSFFS